MIFSLVQLSFSLPVRSVYQEALRDWNTGRFERAKRKFYAYYQAYPNTYRAPYALYRYAQLLDSFPEVALWLKKILKQYDNFQYLDQVLDDLGALYYLLEDWNRAEYYYKQLYFRFRKSFLRPKALYYRVLILLVKKKYVQARKMLQVVLNPSKLGLDVYYQKSYGLWAKSYFYENNYRQAIDIYKKLLVWKSVRTQSLFYLVKSYRQLGKPKKAQLMAQLYEKEDLKGLESFFWKPNSENKPPQEQRFKNLSTFYIVQAGIFANKKNALWIEKQILKQKIPVKRKEIQIEQDTYYKITIEQLKTRAEALRIHQKLQGMGIQSFIKTEILED